MLPTNRYIAQTAAGARGGLSRKAMRRLMARGVVPTEVDASGLARIVRSEFDAKFPETSRERSMDDGRGSNPSDPCPA